MKDIFHKRMVAIAKKTVNLPIELDGLLGGMTIKEAEDFLKKDKEERKILNTLRRA